jgi:urease alpha subunit
MLAIRNIFLLRFSMIIRPGIRIKATKIAIVGKCANKKVRKIATLL